MRQFTLFPAIIGLFLLGCHRATNEQPDDQFKVPPSGYPVSVENFSSNRVAQLVCQLVSQRPAPFPTGYSDAPQPVVFSNLYCTPEVAAAFRSLRELGPTAFPDLVQHLHDDRYSYSDVTAAWDNHSVGDAIIELFCDGHYMHSGYKSRETPAHSDGTYLSFAQYLKSKNAETWANWAKNRTRLEIHNDFVDWCISKENERGWLSEQQREEVLGNYESNRTFVSKEYTGMADPSYVQQRSRWDTDLK